MRKQVRRRHEARVRAQGVCAEHGDFFDATPGGRKARAALDSDVAEIDRLFALQAGSIEDRRAATRQGRASRRLLRDAAKAVVRVGRVLNLDTAVMGTMQLPGPLSDEGLLAYSRGLLDRVSEYADAFVADGLPPDLLQRLGDGIEALAGAREAQAGSRQRFSAASKSIRKTLDHAAKTVDVLESIAITTPGAPSELLTKLRMARRVGPRVTAAVLQPTLVHVEAA